MEEQSKSSVDLQELSNRLGITKSWLLQEAKSGRIPSLKAGKRRVFNVEVVQECLYERAGRDRAKQKQTHSEPYISSYLEPCDRPDDPDEARWLTSLHEAGHAVVAYEFGHAVESVRLWASGGGACVCRNKDMACPEMIAAGPIAQKMYANEPRPELQPVDLNTLGQSDTKLGPNGEIDLARPSVQMSDEERLRCWAHSNSARNPHLWAQRLIDNDRVANRELEAHKASVLNLASALYIQGVLVGDEVTNTMFSPGGVNKDHARHSCGRMPEQASSGGVDQ